MKEGRFYLFAAAFSAAAVLLGGCNTDNVDSNVTFSVKVSSLHYIKDADVTLDGAQSASYGSAGRYDFYGEPITGKRIASGGVYITDETDESNLTAAPLECPQFDTNTTMPRLSAPGNTADTPYEAIYINITPFTSLLAEGNYTAEELVNLYPVAYKAQEAGKKTVINFDFDVTWARKVYDSEDENLTEEICDALHRLNGIQGLYPDGNVADTNTSDVNAS